jgi:hypothetical protein
MKSEKKAEEVSQDLVVLAQDLCMPALPLFRARGSSPDPPKKTAESVDLGNSRSIYK